MECVDEPVFYLSAKSIEDRVSHSREMGGLWATSFIISIFCPIKLVKKKCRTEYSRKSTALLMLQVMFEENESKVC